VLKSAKKGGVLSTGAFILRTDERFIQVNLKVNIENYLDGIRQVSNKEKG
jgi:hypothetical protein